MTPEVDRPDRLPKLAATVDASSRVFCGRPGCRTGPLGRVRPRRAEDGSTEYALELPGRWVFALLKPARWVRLRRNRGGRIYRIYRPAESESVPNRRSLEPLSVFTPLPGVDPLTGFAFLDRAPADMRILPTVLECPRCAAVQRLDEPQAPPLISP
ncbi:MAG TPA: hypothetical protein VNO86_03185 [Candidatus Binatia bacterium]|nr:hypothetical protein [Candidatus Binatia bacterium]